MSCTADANATDAAADVECVSANGSDAGIYSADETVTMAGAVATASVYANVSDATNWTEMLTTAVSVVPAGGGAGGGGGGFGAEVMIPLYSVIFILSIVGNILVIVTLTQNRRMRTVTNVFLLNLVSSLVRFLILYGYKPAKS